MRPIGITTALLALTLAGADAAAAHAQQTPPPSAQWTVNVANGECALDRTIAAPAPLRLYISTTPGSDVYALIVAGPDVKLLPANAFTGVAITFPNAQRFETPGRTARMGSDFGNGLLVEWLEPKVIEEFARASSITLSYGAFELGPIPLPRAAAAVQALNGCVRDQLVEWGADPAQFEPGGKPPVALIPRHDWLPDATVQHIARNKRLRASLRVSISTAGVIDDCALIHGQLHEADAKLACAALLRKRLFTPASDSAGKPVRGVASVDVRRETGAILLL